MNMHKYFLGILLLELFTYTGCKDCERSEIAYIPLPEESLSVNPHKLNDKLVFVDNAGDSIIYICTKKEKSTRDVDGCIECCEDFYRIEEVENTVFESETLDSDLQISISLDFDIITKKTNPSVGWAWSYYENQPNVNGANFIFLPIDSMKQVAKLSNSFSDTLVLRGKTLFNVFILKAQNIKTNEYPVKELYYTIKEGFIGMKFINDNLWLAQ
jgi:hypothetical protein